MKKGVYLAKINPFSMKQVFKISSLIGLMFLFPVILFSQSVLFVNGEATGSNTGDNWENAFTELSDAIDAASEGDAIWVAAGTYLPGGGDPTPQSTFLIDKNIELYGGFSGLEETLDERDFEANETILSGDINGDDIDLDFFQNKEDNVWHVMFLTEEVDNRTIIDGFTIRNGRALGADGEGDDRRGGGILTYGAPIVRNCQFIQNYAWFGGGFYPRTNTASGFRLIDCTFKDNWGGSGASIYMVSLTDGLIAGCVFEAGRAQNSGGGIYIQSAEGEVVDTEFKDNIAVEGRGGATYVVGSTVEFNECQFNQNLSLTSTAGGIHFQDSEYIIRLSEFIGNSGNWGAAVTTYGEESSGQILQSNFRSNSSDVSGGALSIGFMGSVFVDETVFFGNSANFGGAIFLQNDFSEIEIRNSILEENQAFNSGGGIHGSSGQSVSLYNVQIVGNTAARFGGGVNLSQDSLNIATLTLDRCQILANTAGEQGGGINLVDNDVMIVNSLFAFNLLQFSGPGGAISNNSTISEGANITLLNSTLTDNSATIGAGISNWTTDTSVALVALQNTILHNPFGDDYEIEDGQPTVVSMGGNFSSDNSLQAVLDHDKDLLLPDPLFESPQFLDFRLSSESPCINHGVNDGAPDVDLAGNPRTGTVDQGAFEYQGPNSVFDFENLTGNFHLYPNPTVDFIRLVAEFPANGELDIRIYDTQGRLVIQENAAITDGDLSMPLSVNSLTPGNYFVQVLLDGRSAGVKSFAVGR